MTTSGISSNLQTVRGVITDALRELQIIGANRTPSAADAEFCMGRLNWMLKEWQDDGLNLWRQEDATINWAANTASQDLDQQINDIVSLRFVDGYERELSRWEIGDYQALPNKAAPGSPSCYTITKGVVVNRLSLWPVPTAPTVLLASINRKFEDVTEQGQTLDVPQQWTRTVMMNLASNIAASFGRASDPNTVVTVREAAQLYQLMRGADRPASYYLGPRRGRRYG